MKQPLTDQQIAELFGITDQQSAEKIVLNIRATVESRFAHLLSELLSEDQLEEVTNMQKDNHSFEAIESWVFSQVPEAQEAYEALLSDHIDELKAQAQNILKKN